jgi:hypothetical protein
MKTIRYCLLAVVISLMLVACSLKLEVALFNNSGETVAIRSGTENVVIGPMQSKQVGFPGEGQGWTLELQTSQCNYTYSVPRTLEHYQRGGPLKNVIKV